ncbi:MAG: hypothetical protein C0622_11960, partial [Desulfuromonas sp.]
GATLGRKVKAVMEMIDAMKPIIDDQFADIEIGVICRNFPELEHYRAQAAMNLRPHLTYAELEAMRNSKRCGNWRGRG